MPFQRSTALFKDLPSFPGLTKDYLENAQSLRPFFAYRPDMDGVLQSLAAQNFSSSQRKIVSETFKKQYKNFETDKKVELNIQLLEKENTFTVCTGHQCCLLTGPLYFIGKIINTLVLAEELNKKVAEKKFVPVLWLHTEDHDLEEIDHVQLFGKVIRWEHGQTGAAGDLHLDGFEDKLKEIEVLIEKEKFGAEIMSIIRKHFTSGNDLASATQGFVNELFGKYGLLVLDPRDAALKNLFKDVLSEEVREQTSEKILKETNLKLKEQRYEPSVNPREINIFYLSPGKRERIIKADSGFRVAEGEKRWTTEELNTEIDTHPEHFSPNVVLRPVYQQRILPNLAYVGGPAEIAYWLQFKGILDHWKVPVPVLIQRNIVFWFNAARAEKWSSLGLEPGDILVPEDKLIAKILASSGNAEVMERSSGNISEEMKRLAESVGALDASLKGAVAAEETKMLKGLHHLQQKLTRSLKAREEVKLNKMRSVLNRICPNGEPEERRENFIHWYAILGPLFFDTLIENFEVFPKHIIILKEEK